MATAAVTYVFTNGTSADASEVNSNFTALTNFLNNSVVHRDGSKAMTASFDAGSNKIVNVSTPTASTDAANKAYVDGLFPVETSNIDDDAVTDAKIGAPSTGTLTNIRYARMGNIVHVWTTGNTSGGTLPSGYRPAVALKVPAVHVDGSSNHYAGIVDITTGGVITVSANSGLLSSGTFAVSFSTV